MKRLAIAAASVLLMLGTAQAQTASPLYGELGYTFLEFKGNGFKANPGAVRGIVGYEFHPNIAAEGMLMFGTNSASDQGTDVKLKNAYGLFVKPKYDFGNVEAFGRLGWVRGKVGVSNAAGSTSDSKSDFAFGLGANYRFNPRMSVGLDWMRYLDKDGIKIQGVTVNFGYRF